MNILGMHFGHDGSICVLRNGKIASYIYRERISRVKHAIGLSQHELDLALTASNLTLNDIDYCSITSTQGIELICNAINDFSIVFKPHPDDTLPKPFYDLVIKENIQITNRLSFSLQQIFKDRNNDAFLFDVFSAMCLEKNFFIEGKAHTIGCLDDFVNINDWIQGKTLGEIRNSNASGIYKNDNITYGFHYPITVNFAGKSIPGQFISHHMAHAASNFFRSPFQKSIIITHDGAGEGHGYLSGMIYYGENNTIKPLFPHYLDIGSLYDRVSYELNLGSVGAAGKLMGLAPYGRPTFYHPKFIGNYIDFQRNNKQSKVNAWIEHIGTSLKRNNYDLSKFAQKDAMLDPINTDIAASTQRLFEETYLETIKAAYSMANNTGISTKNLCLSGGTALNCPTNSRVFRESPYQNVFIEPSCGDDGLCIGSALYVYYQLLNNERTPQHDEQMAYIGTKITEHDLMETVREFSDKIYYQHIHDSWKAAAQDLFENKIIGWVEGRSESGPRALGHRSIIANPTYEKNWRRVNEVKRREYWRPFAPAVLEERAHEFFRGTPEQAPYMLFNAQVISNKLPAITHVDGSSRVQTVSKAVGNFYYLLEEFGKLSGIPVVLNTSFNGPNEPIVETAKDAINFLLSSDIDVVYIANHRITRKL